MPCWAYGFIHLMHSNFINPEVKQYNLKLADRADSVS